MVKEEKNEMPKANRKSILYLETNWRTVAFILLSVIILLTIVLGFHLMAKPICSNVLRIRDNAELELQANQDFLIFYGVLFLTAVTGILTMTPHFNEKHYGEKKVLSAIYIGLLVIMLYSISSSWDILRENNDLFFNSGLLGTEWSLYFQNRGIASWLFNQPLLEKILLWLLMSFILVIFELLLSIKVGWFKRAIENHSEKEDPAIGNDF
jgi:hypothetical protein